MTTHEDNAGIVPEAVAWQAGPKQPRLADGQVHVWLLPLGTCADNPHAGRLSSEELARANGFRFPAHRNRFIAAHALLRLILSDYLGSRPEDLQFRTAAKGKPALAESCGGDRLRFNLAHSGDLGLLAVCAGADVGIDVERINPDVDAESISRFFSAAEREWIRSRPPEERIRQFYIAWTCKEAYLKMTGEGLSAPLDSFDVLPAKAAGRMELTVAGKPEEARRLSLHTFAPSPGYIAAAAVERHSRQFRYWQLENTSAVPGAPGN